MLTEERNAETNTNEIKVDCTTNEINRKEAKEVIVLILNNLFLSEYFHAEVALLILHNSFYN